MRGLLLVLALTAFTCGRQPPPPAVEGGDPGAPAGACASGPDRHACVTKCGLYFYGLKVDSCEKAQLAEDTAITAYAQYVGYPADASCSALAGTRIWIKPGTEEGSWIYGNTKVAGMQFTWGMIQLADVPLGRDDAFWHEIGHQLDDILDAARYHSDPHYLWLNRGFYTASYYGWFNYGYEVRKGDVR